MGALTQPVGTMPDAPDEVTNPNSSYSISIFGFSVAVPGHHAYCQDCKIHHLLDLAACAYVFALDKHAAGFRIRGNPGYFAL